MNKTTYASKSVKDINIVTRVEIINGSFTIDLKGVFVHLDIDTSPPDVIFASLFIYNPLVFGRTSGFLS